MSAQFKLVDQRLDAGALRALAFLGAPPPDWVLPREGVDLDVAIIGGGQNGVALSFALRRLGVHKVAVFDAATKGKTGVWRHPARMHTLRTSKGVGGPELGIPELSFRYWFEARFGAAAFEALSFIRRADWADYLDWFRDITAVAVQYQHRLTRLEPISGGLELTLVHEGVEITRVARKVILATGVVGFGGPAIPEDIIKSLPRHAFAHTGDVIDFDALRGKSVAVLGSAASAFDAAGVALEHGAAEVHLFSRRDGLARHAPAKSRGFPGAANNFHLLSDAERWELGVLNKRNGLTAPRDAILRVLKHDNFFFHTRSRWSDIGYRDGKAQVSDSDERFSFDFVIAGTGYRTDVFSQPELAPIAETVALWADRYVPPEALLDPDLAQSPYLGAGYELSEKWPGSAPLLKDIHVCSAAGTLSFGRPIGDVPSMANGLTAITNAVVRDLYFADAATYLARAKQLPAPEFEPEFYEQALWRPASGKAAE